MRDSTRISLRLPGDLLERLDAEARSRRVERSELVREMLEVALSGAKGGETPWDRASGLVGRHCLGVPDLGARHREHLLEVLLDRR